MTLDYATFDYATTRRLRLDMEISLFQADEPLRFERIVLYPYPDLKRLWTRAWLTVAQGEKPNIEIVVLNPNGRERQCLSAGPRRAEAGYDAPPAQPATGRDLPCDRHALAGPDRKACRYRPPRI